METIKPVYKKLLIAAIVIYVIGVASMLADIYMKVGAIEHALVHISCEHRCDYKGAANDNHQAERL